MLGLYSANKTINYFLLNEHLCKGYRDKNKGRANLKFRSKQPRKSANIETYSILHFQVYSMELRPGILEISAEPTQSQSQMI